MSDHSSPHALLVAAGSWALALVGEAVQDPRISLGSILLGLLGFASVWAREHYRTKRAELHSRNDAAELLAYRTVYGPIRPGTGKAEPAK